MPLGDVTGYGILCGLAVLLATMLNLTDIFALLCIIAVALWLFRVFQVWR